MMRADLILFAASLFGAGVSAPGAAQTTGRPPIYSDFPVNPAEQTLQARGFGPPRNDAEWAYDEVVGTLFSGRIQDSWFSLVESASDKLVWVFSEEDTSDRLTRAYRAALVAERCNIGGTRVEVRGKERCGFFEMPMLCDDTTRRRYFKTLRVSAHEIIFRELDVDVRMAVDDGRWKIDGTRCTAGEARGLAINWDRNRSGR
jgi:hypothetical protein